MSPAHDKKSWLQPIWNLQVLLAAGDTFRAAAAEQLQLWADRSGVAVHTATRGNARPDNVLYEAVGRVSLH